MRNLTLLFLVFFSLNCTCQVWCTPGSVWRFKDLDVASYGQKQLDYLHDTLIGNITCNMLREWRHGIYPPNGTYSKIRYLYTYTSNNVVYLKSHITPNFDTLYNFNASIGDKWRTPDTYFQGCATSFVTVVDTGRSNIQGVSLKWIKVQPTTSNYVIGYPRFSGVVYERIGAVQCYPYFWANNCPNNVDAGIGGALLCFSDNQITEYRQNYTESCDHIYVSANEFQSEDSSIQLYPNPSTGLYSLSLLNISASPEPEVVVSDISGRKLKQFSLYPQQAKHLLDLTNLANGVYLVTITQNNRSIYTTKLVKQD